MNYTGVITRSFHVKIETANLLSLRIYFDKENEQWPKRHFHKRPTS
jgi:hypothetical protein